MQIEFEGDKYLIPRTVYQKMVAKCGKKQSASAKKKGYSEVECSECGNLFLRFYASKAKLCCTCRQVRRRIKFESVCKVNDGFPRETAITSISEIEDYYSHEKITCLLCGNEYSMLNQHLNAIHEMTADEYKLQFGLYLSRGLTGTVVKKKNIEHGFMIIEKHGSKLPLPNNRACLPKNRGFKHAPALKKKQSINCGEGAKKSPNHISKRTALVDAFCSDCGDEIEQKLTEMTVLTRGCVLLCKRCKSKHHKESQERWAKKKGIDIVEWRREISRRYLRRKKMRMLKGTGAEQTRACR